LTAYENCGLTDADLKKKIGNDWLASVKETNDFSQWLEALELVNPADIDEQKISLADQWIAKSLIDGDYQTAYDVTNKIQLAGKDKRQAQILGENILAYCSNQISKDIDFPKTFKIVNAYVITNTENVPTYENVPLVCIEFTGKAQNTQTFTNYAVFEYNANTKTYVVQGWVENLLPAQILPTDTQQVKDKKTKDNKAIETFNSIINYINQNGITADDADIENRINELIANEKISSANPVKLIVLS
jgi:hypothetical protein